MPSTRDSVEHDAAHFEGRLDIRPGEVCCTTVMPLTDKVATADRA